MAEQPVQSGAAAAGDRRHYDLFTITGKKGMPWKLRDEGIRIEDGSRFCQKGEVPNTASLKNVREIRLMVAQTKDGTSGSCLITFRNNAELTTQ